MSGRDVCMCVFIIYLLPASESPSSYPVNARGLFLPKTRTLTHILPLTHLAKWEVFVEEDSGSLDPPSKSTLCARVTLLFVCATERWKNRHAHSRTRLLELHYAIIRTTCVR